MNPIDIVICNDNLLIRKGLVDIISQYSSDITIRAAENGKEIISLIEQETPYAIMLEIKPDLSGIETLLFVRQYWPTINLIPYSTQLNSDTISQDIILSIPFQSFNRANQSSLEEFVKKLVDNPTKKTLYLMNIGY